MSERRPRVSVGVPVYNGERYLQAALESLRAQDFADFEVIVSDNASQDGTRAICERFVALDPRFRYVRSESNLGAARNYNRLVDLARGELFRWNPHDDLCDRATCGAASRPSTGARRTRCSATRRPG
jgi:glycosyltransferase involved in cell wall biosynthesis